VAAQEPPGEDAVRRDTDAELPAGRQDLVPDSAGEQRVLDLKVSDRVDAVRATDCIGTGLRQPDVPDISGLHHLRDRTDRLLDRNRGVNPA
jgi:hypothetical protein